MLHNHLLFETEPEIQEKRAPEEKATGSTLLHRRSYKGFNGMVEQSMKDLLKKHAFAKAQDEELEQALDSKEPFWIVLGMRYRCVGEILPHMMNEYE